MPELPPDNMRGTPPNKKMMELFVRYMAEMHADKWGALVACSWEVEERLRDSFYKTWNGPLSAHLGRMEEAGAFTSSGRHDSLQIMPELKTYITVSLLPGIHFFNNPPRPSVDVCIKYGSYMMQHCFDASEFENSSNEAIKQRVLGLEQHLKLRIGA